MAKKPRIMALVVAAGSGSRVGEGVPKQYRTIGRSPMLRLSIEALLSHNAISNVLVVIAPGHEQQYASATQGLTLLPPVLGGNERQDSVKAGLEALAAHQPDYVVIHDAARPLLSQAMIDRIIAALDASAAVVPSLAIADTVRRSNGAQWEEVARQGLMRMQTPQAFPFAALLALHRNATHAVTDDAALWLHDGRRLITVAGDEQLRKITTAEDLMWVASMMPQRIAVGMGYDVHRLVDGTTITLGGIRMTHTKTLHGHSDADVVLHALVDALLGALAEGDIGTHFPPSDPQWKGADSAQFVAHALARATARHATILHADLTIICEAPKIAPHREAMRARIAQLLAIETARVSVKATTTEGLGFTGRNEGIAAQAIVTLSLPV